MDNRIVTQLKRLLSLVTIVCIIAGLTFTTQAKENAIEKSNIMRAGGSFNIPILFEEENGYVAEPTHTNVSTLEFEIWEQKNGQGEYTLLNGRTYSTTTFQKWVLANIQNMDTVNNRYKIVPLTDLEGYEVHYIGRIDALDTNIIDPGSLTPGQTFYNIIYKYVGSNDPVVVDSISVSGPAKSEYFVGDTFDTAGLTVKARYSDGSEKEIAEGDYTISAPDMSNAGNKTVTVGYEGKEANFDIQVHPKLDSLVVSGSHRTSYLEGESFNPAGMTVTAQYNDGSEKMLDAQAYAYTPNGALTASDNVITVSYEERGISKTAEVAIDVQKPVIVVVDSISVSGPAKSEYFVGDTFDTAGLTVKARYSDGSEKEIAEGDYTISAPDMSSAGNKTVTVGYEGKEANFDIQVYPKLDSLVVSGSHRTSYLEGESFDPTGMTVTARYNDGSEKMLDAQAYAYTPDGALTASDNVITVSYEERGISKTVEVAIAVNEIYQPQLPEEPGNTDNAVKPETSVGAGTTSDTVKDTIQNVTNDTAKTGDSNKAAGFALLMTVAAVGGTAIAAGKKKKHNR